MDCVEAANTMLLMSQKSYIMAAAEAKPDFLQDGDLMLSNMDIGMNAEDVETLCAMSASILITIAKDTDWTLPELLDQLHYYLDKGNVSEEYHFDGLRKKR